MDSIRLKNFRCFRDVEYARMAPLTLLVGENSTGKTSFMAMARILHDIAGRNPTPNFKAEPYDLGSFDEIAYRNSSYQAETFEAGFNANLPLPNTDTDGTESTEYTVNVKFGKMGTSPVPIRRFYSFDNTWIDHTYNSEGKHIQRVRTKRGEWVRDVSELFSEMASMENLFQSNWLSRLATDFFRYGIDQEDFAPVSGHEDITEDDLSELASAQMYATSNSFATPFAGAPVRSKPRRTYDPEPPQLDSEGNHIPMYLADVSSRAGDEWENIKSNLENFGRESGLFDKINIRNLGDRGSDPFQIEVQKSENGDDDGVFHNLIDVGYGISQVLPVVTQTVRDVHYSESEFPQLFLIQQPEVHLHPSAQAALGSLFCQLASRRNQIIVETHSDHLMDRVRMDARDGVGQVKPEDVSILYFERSGAEVNIHSLGVDDNGNVTGAPNSYRRFFMEETKRDIGL